MRHDIRPGDIGATRSENGQASRFFDMTRLLNLPLRRIYHLSGARVIGAPLTLDTLALFDDYEAFTIRPQMKRQRTPAIAAAAGLTAGAIASFHRH
jgi:hypothetical protein